LPTIPTPTAGDAKSSGSRNTANSKANAGTSLTDWAKQDGGKGRMILPTPSASQYGTSQNGTRADGSTFKQAGKPSLWTMAKKGILPTPSARDFKSGKGRKENGHTPQLPEVMGGMLNPDFVQSYLMGFPDGWLD